MNAVAKPVTGVKPSSTDAFLAKFDEAELASVRHLYEQARDLGTAGGAVSAQVLLGLYNGERFPFDLTELRRLDRVVLQAALTTIAMDARWCRAEVHVVLMAIVRDPLMQWQFERWAYSLGLKGSATQKQIAALRERLAR